MFFMERVTSWWRRSVRPASSENAEIILEKERPWLQEQMAFWSNTGFRRDSNLEPLTGETWEHRKLYRQMLAEPTVKAAFLGKLGSVASQELRCNPPPGEGDNPFAKEVADFAQANLIGPSGTSYELIWEIGSGMLIEGFSVCEKLFKYEERGRWKGKWRLDRLKAKDTQFLQLETDRYRNVVGLYSNTGGQGATPFDPADFVIATYLSFFSNPHGISDFRASTRATELIISALKLRSLTLGKNSGPYLVAKIADKRFRAATEVQLRQARANHFIVLDHTTELEVLDLASRGTSEFQQAIDDLRKEIAIGLQGAFLQMLEGMGNDNRGSADVQKDTSEIFAWLVSVIITGVINRQLMPDLVYPNFGDDAPLPICQLGAVNPADVLAELRIDELLINIGVDISKADVLMRANRKAPRDANDTIKGRGPNTMVAAPSALATPFSEEKPDAPPLADPSPVNPAPAAADEKKNLLPCPPRV